MVPVSPATLRSVADELDRLKAANAELAEACEAVIKRADGYYDAYNHKRDIERANTDTADALAKCRAALTKHRQGEAK